MHDGQPAAIDPDQSLSWQDLLRRFLVGLAVLMVGIGLLAWALRPAIEAASQSFIARAGLPGIFAGCAVLDVMMIPKEPILLAAYAAKVEFWTILAVASSGSIAAGVFGWLCGRGLGRREWVQRRFERYKITALMERYGLSFLVVAALAPFPFSVAVWAAGASGMPFWRFALCLLFRIPKILMSLGVIAGGWGFGAWMHGAG